ncbi:MAG: hypothetical protein LBI10_06805, partial [Deltaproteobacteria bacterium]|nr:hypothetical protein [Deltaproteobacteria bacterium]
DSLIINSIDTAIANVLVSFNNNILSKEVTNNIQNALIDLTNEALTHLVLYAFLQRVLNGGADFIQREYDLGTLRADIRVSYKGRRYPLELKIKGRKSLEESFEQLSEYMNKCLASEGWLVVFDKNFDKLWPEKLYWKTQEYKGYTIHVVGC